jgi:hypothetical protein
VIRVAAGSKVGNKDIAAMLGTCTRDGVDGLYDESRPGAPRQIGENEMGATLPRSRLSSGRR